MLTQRQLESLGLHLEVWPNLGLAGAADGYCYYWCNNKGEPICGGWTGSNSIRAVRQDARDHITDVIKQRLGNG